MKHVIQLAGILLLLAAGCRSTDSIEQLQSDRRSDCDVVTILAPSNNTMTRTTLGKNNETKEYYIYWAPGDKIGVFSNYTNNADFTLSSIGDNQVAFQGTLAGAPTCAYYPYAAGAGDDPEAISLTLPAIQEQTGSDPNMVYDLKAGQRNGGSAASGYTFTFQQKLTLLRFTLTPDASLDGDQLLNIKLTAPEGRKLAGDFTLDITSADAEPVFSDETSSNEVTVIFDEESHINLAANTPVVGYVFINPDIKQGDNLVITVNTNRHIVTTTSATAGEAFQRGALYDISIDINKLGRDVKVEIAQKVLWADATTPGYYSISGERATSIHLYEACKDQYTYSTSGGNYSFTIQSMKKGKLSRLTVIKDEIKNGSTSTNLSATLYTIHGSEGAVAEPGTWTIVEKEGNKYWLKNSDHTKGFILLVEED